MVDIFISYSSKDLSRVETFAKALEKCGWSVWWDRTIPPGKSFTQVIEEAINAARCVVVVWSQNAIQSDWVREEASIGKRRRILIPVKIDVVEPPLGFSLIQAADLTQWDGRTPHPGFEFLKASISTMLDESPVGNKQEKRPAQSAKEKKSAQEVKAPRPHDPQAPAAQVKATHGGGQGLGRQSESGPRETEPSNGGTAQLQPDTPQDAVAAVGLHTDKSRTPAFELIVTALAAAFIGGLYLIYNYILNNIADQLIK